MQNTISFYFCQATASGMLYTLLIMWLFERHCIIKYIIWSYIIGNCRYRSAVCPWYFSETKWRQLLINNDLFAEWISPHLQGYSSRSYLRWHWNTAVKEHRLSLIHVKTKWQQLSRICFCFSWTKDQGPVVQSVVSCFSGVNKQYSDIFCWKKNVSSTAKATHIFSAKIFSIFAYHSM